MITGISDDFAEVLLGQYADAIDAGAQVSKVWIYEGPAPAPGAAVGAQKLLAKVPMPRPFTASLENRILTANAFAPVMATAGGFAEWCRVYDGNGAWVHDGDVSDDQGTGFIRIQGGSNILAGGLVIVTGCTVTI